MARTARLTDRRIARIARAYGLAVRSSAALRGGHANASYALDTDRGRMVLTVFDEGTPADAERLVRVLGRLAEHGFPATRVYRAPGGRAVTGVDGRPVLVKRYIPGRVRRNLDRDMLRQVGAALARLHAIPAPAGLPTHHAYGRRLFPTVLGHGADPAYEAWLAERHADLDRRLPAGPPRGLAHGDLFYDNVLFRGRRLAAIIDFENAAALPPVFDLGMAIVGLCADRAGVDLDAAGALVGGYAAVRPLERRERRALRAYTEYGAIATSCWRYWKYHIDAPTPKLARRHARMARVADGVRAVPPGRFCALGAA